MRYLLGIAAALVAGTAFNVGILIQKSAVDRLPPGKPLLRSLVRRPVWLLGVAVQIGFGTPFYLLAVGLIGPAVVPGLMAIGLAVLASGAIFIRKERLHVKELTGIALIIAAVACFGLSRLSIDVLSFSLTDPRLLARTGVFAGLVAAVALGAAFAAGRISESGAPRVRVERAAALHAVRAGLWYNVSNLTLGFITTGIERLTRGLFITEDIPVVAAAITLALLANLFGVSGTQNALAHGRAAIVVPLQEGIVQLLPVGIFFYVYQPYLPPVRSFVFLGAAAALLIGGILFLTDRLSTTAT